MKAYQVDKFGDTLVPHDVALPEPKGHDVLAKTLVTGVCHTDLHVAHGDFGEVPLPVTPGHEGVGVVVKVGSEVKKLKVGDRIGVPWLGKTCLDCDLCKAGKTNVCENQQQTGFIRDGSFAEYFIADERFSARIPDNLSDVQAAPILCAGITSYKALLLANLKAGDRIVISGACGGLGHLAIQYAKVLKYEVVALDMMSPEKIKKVKELGADFVVDVADTSKTLSEHMATLDNSKKPIVAAIIFAPVLSAVECATQYVSPGGTIVCVALPPGHYKIDVVNFILKELRLQGSIVGTPEELEDALRIAADGKVHAHIEVKDFSEVNNVMKDLEAGKILGRVVLKVASEGIRY